MESGLIADREILVLEDETMLRKRVAAYLEQAGAEVVAVDRLEKARTALKEWTFDFALIDIQLPDGEGCPKERLHILSTLSTTMMVSRHMRSR